jgi:hypothetical protein
MTSGALAFFNRIVSMRVSKTDVCEFMARLAELCFTFNKIILVLRAVGSMTNKTPLCQRLVAFGPSKISVLVTGKALFVSNLFEKRFIIRGMGIVTGETLSLLQCSVHMNCLIHTQGHL